MVENMKKMMKWHLEEFDTIPIGDGYEVEVNEFDFRKANEVCYKKMESLLVTGHVRTERMVHQRIALSGMVCHSYGQEMVGPTN